MTVEEVVEVSMKLNTLRALGIHLDIEGKGEGHFKWRNGRKKGERRREEVRGWEE